MVNIYTVVKDGDDSIILSVETISYLLTRTKATLTLEGTLITSGQWRKIGHNCYDTDLIPDGVADLRLTLVVGCELTNFQILGGDSNYFIWWQ